jgi:stage II sporulation protein D
VTAAGVPVLRIGIATGLDTLTVGCDAEWRISLRGKARRPNRNAGGTRWSLRAAGGGVGVTDDLGRYRGAFAETLRFYPDGDGAIRVLGRAYRDTIEVFRGGDGRLTVVSVVDVEDYLRGVVAQEIGTGGTDALEAVKAQAVAARTYALSYVGRWKDLGFDLYGDVRDQVYLGISGERERSDRAIAETRGVVGLHDRAYIRANYCSTCGGHTAGNDEVWDQGPLPFLRGRADRNGDGKDFCSASPHYRWEEKIPAETFWKNFRAYRLASDGEVAGESLRDVHIQRRSESGRVRELLVRTSKREIVVTGDAIRWAVRRPVAGDPPLRSTLFDVKIEKSKGRVQDVIVRGRGFGHGVGMCQMGALGMAREGHDYEQILRHYYHGISLRRFY